jgi:hypothetical protein
VQGLIAIGLVITCLAGFRIILFGVDLVAGNRPFGRIRGADMLLIGLSIFGMVCLVIGLLQLHAQGK